MTRSVTVKSRLELPQSLAEVFFGLRGHGITPEDGRKRFTVMGAVAVKQKIAEEFLELTRFATDQAMAVQLHLQLAKERKMSRAHRSRLLSWE